MTSTGKQLPELTIRHYKEPLKRVSGGFGFYGALSSTLDGDKIQCHICGELYSELGAHVRQSHEMNVADYKEKFQLSRTTSLISEVVREERKQRTLLWLSKLTPHEKRELRRKADAGYRKWLAATVAERHARRFTFRLEVKNKNGTCPDQLIAKIQEIGNKLGHTPSLSEFIHETGTQRYKHLIFKVFGSWLNALKVAKLQPKVLVQNGGRRNYDDEELLEYLRIYTQENRKIPTATDCRRGLIPSYEVYQRHFGSFPKARVLAGVYDFIDYPTITS